VTGHVNSTFILRLLREFWPFYSKNLIVEDGSSKVHFIDTSVYPDSDNPNQKTKFKRKLITDTRVLNYYLGIVLLRTGEVLHDVRDRFVTERSTPQERQMFINGFIEVVAKLNEAGIDYRVVGSCALAATLAKYDVDFPLNPRRVNGTIRDIDIIAFEPEEKISSLKGFFDQKSKKVTGYPEVSLSATCDNGQHPADQLLCFNYRNSSGQFCKRYKTLELPFIDEDMIPYRVKLFGVEFNTFLPEVQLGLYFIRGGSFKFKDLVKMAILSESTGRNVPIKFRDFGLEIRKTYSKKHQRFELRELINYWSGGAGTIAKKELKKILPSSIINFGKNLLSQLTIN
jgi:hypothetical protein